MKRTIIFIPVISLILCACNRLEAPENRVDDSAMVYHIDIQAGFNPQTKGVTFGSDGATIATQFATTDNVYVYNETKGAFARMASDGHYSTLIALHPSNISWNVCNLVGDLSFYVWNSLSEKWDIVSVDDGDKYSFFYQMNIPSPGHNNYPCFDYTTNSDDTINPNGSMTNVSEFDFAEATGVELVKKASSLTIPSGVLLENLQSMYRLRVSYTNGGVATTPSTIASLSVNSKNGTLIYNYSPTHTNDPSRPDAPYSYGSFSLVSPVFSADNDIYLSLSFHYDANHLAEGDELILKAKDVFGNIYQGSIAAPSGGFLNSHYYYGSISLAWQGQDLRPTITPGSTESYTLYTDGNYDFDSDNPDPTAISISGNSAGYYFTFTNNARITLSGNGTAIYSGTEPFIFSEYGITIILSDNYTVDCRNNDSAIWADWGDLTLETLGGGSYTLTVIASDPNYRGLYGDTNYDDDSCDPSVLAAAGFSVALTSTTPGPDEDTDGNPDYYTWVYTVAPATP